MNMFHVGAAVAMAFSAVSANAFTFSDSFSGSGPDPVWWTAGASGGNTITQAGGQLLMTQSDIAGTSGLSFNFAISGDFDFRVDYQLLEWPANNYERIGLSSSTIGATERSQHPGWFDEAYVSHFSRLPGNVLVTLPTSDRSGTLRMVRSGSTVTGSFWNGSGWTELSPLTDAAVPADTLLGIAIWNGYASVPVTVAFDNAYLDAPSMTNPIPEPASGLLLAAGLAGLGLAQRKTRR